MRISIIGGYGEMGQIFAKMFSKDGHKVVISGPNEVEGRKIARELKVEYERGNKKAAADGDIVIISVPIKKTVEVIREVASHLDKGSLLMDLTSVKVVPCKAMAEFAGGGTEVLGCHPLFGPMDSPKGQNMVLCPIRTGKLSKWVSDYFTKKGFVVSKLSPDEHDRVMATVQALLHSVSVTYGEVVNELRVEALDKLTTPKSREMLKICEGYMKQHKDLTEGVRELNPHFDEAIAAFREKLRRVSGT